MESGFQFRPGTSDEAIFHNVFHQNEYGLPDRLGSEAVIIDIGVHIGSFCYTALSRGASRVFGFEADPENFRCAKRNLAPFGDRAQIRHAAAWRSDERVASLNLCDCPEPTNTGWREVFGEGTGTSVAAVPFDEIVRDATDYGRKRVSILKIDCEGSEFPILLTSRTLNLVDTILGEFHEFNSPNYPEPIPTPARVPGYDRYTMAELTPVLERWGFSVTVKPYPNSRLGIFWARRTPARVSGPHFLSKVRSLVRPTS